MDTGGYLTWLKQLITLFDRAMDEEGVTADVRDRVVERVYGARIPKPEPVPALVLPPMNPGVPVSRTLHESK